MTTIWTPERIAIARREFGEWEGTRHRNRMARKGVGVDCIHFVAAVLIAAGIVPPFRFPSYNPSRGILAERNAMGDIMRRATFSAIVPADAPLEFGDIAIFRVGRVSNHVAICDGEMLWHSLAGARVMASKWRIWEGEVQERLRIEADGLRERPEGIKV